MKDTKFCVCIQMYVFMSIEVCIDKKLVTQIDPQTKILTPPLVSIMQGSSSKPNYIFAEF